MGGNFEQFITYMILICFVVFSGGDKSPLVNLGKFIVAVGLVFCMILDLLIAIGAFKG